LNLGSTVATAYTAQCDRGGALLGLAAVDTGIARPYGRCGGVES
jgi:hypothetical protein